MSLHPIELLIGKADTILVLAKTIFSAEKFPAIDRKATYVFTRDSTHDWLCCIDNSYGHDLLQPNS